MAECISNSGVVPIVSVVIPAHDRPQMLLVALQALCQQTLDPELYEIIVADDGSQPPLETALQELLTISDVTVHFVRQEPVQGPAAARNLGIRHSRGKYVAFTDDDCVPEPSWLENLLLEFGGSDVGAVEGQTVVPRPQRPTPYTTLVTGLARCGGYQTCNMAYRHIVLAQLGGFDARFDKPHREDTDLALSTLAAGYQILYAADAVVHHPLKPVPGLRDELSRLLWSRYDFLLWLKHKPLYGQHIGRLVPPTFVVNALALVAFVLATARGWWQVSVIALLFFIITWARIVRGRLVSTQPTPNEVGRIMLIGALISPIYLSGLLWGVVKFATVWRRVSFPSRPTPGQFAESDSNSLR